MDARTLEALKASIAKWERNAIVNNIEDGKVGVSNCPLCYLFHSDGCAGCPVFSAGHYRCGDTPYDMAELHHSLERLEEFRAAATDEVAFLKSLLPTDEAAS